MIEITDIVLPNDVAAEPCAGGYVLHGSRTSEFREAEFGPIQLAGLSRYMAICQFNTFMTEPRWGSDLSQIPDECQFVLWQADDGGYGMLVPILSGDFRTRVRGIDGGLGLFTECGPVGRAEQSLPLAYVRYGSDPHDMIERGMAEVVGMIGLAKLRKEKPVPDFVNYLGWCTWDAFYEAVDQRRIIEGLKSFKERGIMPGFVIIDEGWQDTDAKKYLLSYGADDGFDERRVRAAVDIAKNDYGVRYMAVWRTLFGALRAIRPGSPALAHLKAHIVPEPNTDGDTFGVVEPESVHQFQDEYAAQIAEDGIDFVKVDFQSALKLMTYDHAGRVGAMTNWQYALQDSVKKHFGGMMINCMSGTTDAVYNYRDSTVTRSSDDFGPKSPDSMQPRHIIQNMFNGLWMGKVCVCDWDMFWSEHPWAEYHAIARAVSGGPIYVSDKPGHTNADLLHKLIAADGKVLRCDQPALPTRDTLLVDYTENRTLIKGFNTCGNIGVLGLFHPNPESDGEAITETVSPCLVEPLGRGRYAAYSVRSGFAGTVTCDEGVSVSLEPRQADVVVFSPINNGFAAIGLIDKFNPAAAVLSTLVEDNTATFELRGGGRAGIYCERPVKEVLIDGAECRVESDDDLVVIDTGSRSECRITLTA